jgi:SAM-dependent methyltransferase
MFTLDPARAATEIARVLRPGGRLAAAVWAPPAANPWLRLVFEAASAEFGAPIPPPGMPGPFSRSDPGRLAALLREAGLADVVVREFTVDLRSPSVDDWFNRTTALAGPLAKRLAALPAERLRALRNRLATAAEPYRTPAGLVLPGLSLLASGRKPA